MKFTLILHRSWFQATKAEIAKRSIQSLKIKATNAYTDSECDSEDAADCADTQIYKSLHISQSLRIEPFHSFIFYAGLCSYPCDLADRS